MTEDERKVMLITGASAGLGLVLTRRLLAEDRYRLVLTARERSLPRFAAAGIHDSEHVMTLPLDVVVEREREAAVAAVARRWAAKPAGTLSTAPMIMNRPLKFVGGTTPGIDYRPTSPELP